MGRKKSGITRICKNLSVDKDIYKQIEFFSDETLRPISRIVDEALLLVLRKYDRDWVRQELFKEGQ